VARRKGADACRTTPTRDGHDPAVAVTGGEDHPERTAAPELLGAAVVANVIAARMVNEAIRDGRRDGGAPASFICECGALGCRAMVELASVDYEFVRADPRHFVVVPGHTHAQDEILATSEQHVIVAKHAVAGDVAAGASRRVVADEQASYRVPTLSFTFPAIPEAVPRARHWVDGFVKAHADNAELRGRILLAFTEAFTNAVVHAYDSAHPGPVDVAADIEADTLEIVVMDQGRGLAASQVDGLGAGLSIIVRSTDAFAIRERSPTGTEVWLRFTLGRPTRA
jgi:anti-sigma regulatory factor (Ser/Thr protein kinase)